MVETSVCRGLPILRTQRAKQLPILTGGWLEDIHDPHNWYQPYTTGTYGGRQSLPDDVKAQFKDILDRGVAETRSRQARGDLRGSQPAVL